MDSIGIVSIPIQSMSPNPFHRIGMDIYCNGYLSIDRRRSPVPLTDAAHAGGSGALREYGEGKPSPQAVFRPAAVRQTTVKSAA